MKIFKPPTELPKDLSVSPSLFLAGSIEQGTAENWQEFIEEETEDIDGYLLNPRRNNWDPSWAQTINNLEFYNQVNWELDGLEKSEVVLMYFSPGTKSPITLLELGLFADHEGLIVCCPQGFWRKGNVDIVCERNNITLTESLSVALEWTRESLY